jgi:DNA repair protein RecO (recombination protein O)
VRQLVTTGIILRRTDYGEADRILTMLTPDQGKLRLMAKGVRRVKSKLAGGIELFSVSHVTYIQGRKEIGTLISARLVKHYGGIVKDIQRTMLGYDLIKRLDKATEDEPEPEYFELLQQAFEALDDMAVGLELVRLWFMMQLLRLGGHTPNLQSDIHGDKLLPDSRYSFSFDDMTFTVAPNGPFTANHIKFLRLGFAGHQPKALGHVQGSNELAAGLIPLVQTMLQTYIRS